MPCASPDLKQAGACGRRPGQVSRGGGKQPKKNTLEASKGNQNQPYLIQLGEGLPTVFFLPPTVSDTVGFGYPQTGRQRRTTGHKQPKPARKIQKNMENIGFTCFSCCFHHQVPSLAPTVSDMVGSALPPRDRPGGIRASDLKAPSLNCLSGTSPGPPKIQNPESKIQNSPIQNPNFFGRISGILDVGFWIVM